jgi:hypothetical protein
MKLSTRATIARNRRKLARKGHGWHNQTEQQQQVGYPNKTINDGPYGSFMADPEGSGIGIYIRCKFANPTTVTPDGKPILQICSATEVCDVVTMQPIAAGAYGTVKFINCGGETYGIMNGNVNSGTQLYAAASGEVSASSAGSALKVGMTTSTGNDNGPVTYAPTDKQTT